MNYLWQKFNIKTFPAETIVYRDGVFDPSLSTIESGVINQDYDKPVHIIYVGDICGENGLIIDLPISNQSVFLSVKTTNKKPAFLNIFIKNTGKKSVLKGKVLLHNFSDLKFQINADHFAENTGILIETKLIAESKSCAKLTGIANIDKNCVNCDSDIGFSALTAPDAKIEFTPAQRIKSVPEMADHAASIYKGTSAQIEFLRGAGLSQAEIKQALEEAFTNDFLVF